MDAKNFYVVDFETYYDDDYSVSAMPYWHYAHHKKFDAYQVSIVGPDISYVGSVAGAPWASLIGKPLAAHNAGFDEAVLQSLIEQGKVPALNTPNFLCTLDLCAFHQMPRSLKAAAKEVLGLEVSKTVRDKMKGKPWASLSAPDQAELSAYALKDSVMARDILLKLGPTWPVLEQKLSTSTRRAGNDGLYIDREALEKAINLLSLALFHLGKMMPWYTSSDVKPLALIHIREQGRKDNIPVPGSLDLRDPDALVWEARYAPTYAWVRAIRGFRRVNALLKKLETLRGMLRPDGTAPFRLNYFGAAGTGRWSGAGGFNLQNMPKFPIVVCKSCFGCNFDDGTLLENVEKDTLCPFCQSTDVEFIDMRDMIMAPPGKVFVVSDYAQVEARVLLWLVNDKAALDLIRGGMSVYESHARATMGWTGGDLKEENKKLYALAKARTLGAGFGCAGPKFVVVAKAMARLDISLADAANAISEYRASNPGVVSRWRKHQFYLTVSANHNDDTHEVPLRSGRTIRYFKPHYLREAGAKYPEIAAHTVLNDPKQLRRFYGGKLTENEVQATARDLLGESIVALEDRGIPVSFHAHDEIVAVVDEDRAAEGIAEVSHVMKTSAKWAESCPLGTDIKASRRYFGK